MKLGIVIGQVIATRKDERLVGCKLLITQPVDTDHQPQGDPLVAVDTVGAGVGETVLYVSGSIASKAVKNGVTPVDTAIVGIVDNIDCYR